MIHSILLSMEAALPFSPPAAVIGVTILIIAGVLSLYGRSKSTVLFSLGLVLLGGALALGLSALAAPGAPHDWSDAESLAESLIGPSSHRGAEAISAAMILVALLLFYAVYNLAFQEKPGERPRRLLQQDEEQGKALGSAHLCSADAYSRWKKPDSQGWMIRGKFYGAHGRRLGDQFCLSGEDVARGVAVFGVQGTGKTQSVILPAIADRMRDGHSLIVTDVQGELLPYIRLMAGITGHMVIVHNPNEPEMSCRINLCDWIDNVADAHTMATVLTSGGSLLSQGGDVFWTNSAINLIAACALHYPTVGGILQAKRDVRAMAEDLMASQAPGAADLAADFAASILSKDPKLGLNILTTATTLALGKWTDSALQNVTSRSDVDLAVQMTGLPTVVVLSCAARNIETYGPYLGTVLRVVTMRLDDIGQQQPNGQLPRPVGLILEEFPALGRLDSLVRDINLIRKRRISVLTAAQSMAQFDRNYPAKGEAEQLMAGLATKIVFGGCDQRTADFFSRLSGQQTIALSSLSRVQRKPGNTFHDTGSASLRERPLLLPDDIIRPFNGHATVFAAYSGGGRADQAIFHAELTPFFQRKDWKLERARPVAPLVMPDPATAAAKQEQPEKERDTALDLARAFGDVERQPWTSATW